MKNKIILAGGTGFVGSYFAKQFQRLGYEVIIISRQKTHVHWNDTSAIIAALEQSAMVINLAGKSVNCRYTSENKAAILQSRIDTTNALGAAILQCQQPPSLWINASAASIYRHEENRPMSENETQYSVGFSSMVAKTWEETFYSFKLPKTRQVALRISIVLGRDGGVMVPFKNIVRFGLGGKQGSGKQMFSWIHVEDLFQMVLFIQSHPSIQGAVNGASPYPVDNQTLMSSFRKVMHVPIGIPAPAWGIKIGTFILGTESELVLGSQWVLPKKMLDAGFTFQFPTLQEALQDLVK